MFGNILYRNWIRNIIRNKALCLLNVAFRHAVLLNIIYGIQHKADSLPQRICIFEAVHIIGICVFFIEQLAHNCVVVIEETEKYMSELLVQFAKRLEFVFTICQGIL